MNIAIIPARGGSKRIPQKNIKDFCGKPMLAWSIEKARAAKIFDHIIVSTDDAEIGAVAEKWGAEVPFLRPASLSDDYAGTTEVIAHATQWALDQGWPVTAVCCIYATAPCMQVEDLLRGIEILDSGEWQYVFSVTECAAPVFRSFTQDSQGGVEMLFPEHFKTRSQDLPTALHDAAQFYWGRPAAWLEGKPIFACHSTSVVLPRWRVQDIDEESDWRRAEQIFMQLGATQMTGKPSDYVTQQEEFWAGDFGTEYIGRNDNNRLLASNLNFFAKALRRARAISTCLEFGANIGMNLKALKLLYPDMVLKGIEINPVAAGSLRELIGSDNVYEGSIFNAPQSGKVNLSLIKGVLIHIHPEMLNLVYEKLYEASDRYILVCEYYNPSPVAIPYRGHADRLFKRDFAGEMLDKFTDLVLVDYGFAYRRDPSFPQDDITWFLMEKR